MPSNVIASNKSKAVINTVVLILLLLLSTCGFIAFDLKGNSKIPVDEQLCAIPFPMQDESIPHCNTTITKDTYLLDNVHLGVCMSGNLTFVYLVKSANVTHVSFYTLNSDEIATFGTEVLYNMTHTASN